MLDLPIKHVSEIEKFEALFRQIPAALALLYGPEFVFEMANRDYLKLVGGREVVGKKLLEALPELADQVFPEILKKVYESGEAFHARDIEAFLSLDSNDPTILSRRFIDVSYERVLTRDDQVYGIFVFAVDVTEKVEARLSVQLEQQKLEAVFANATASLAIIAGADQVFEKVNSSYQSLFNNRELVGRKLSNALPELMDQKFPGLLAEVYETGEIYLETEAVAYLRRTDKSPLEKRFFDQSYTRIDDASGRRHGVLIHAIDVTERVNARIKIAESTERFQHAVNAANMGTWNVDMKTGQVEWSARTSELFGIPSDQKVRMEDAVSRIHPDDQENVRRAIEKANDPSGDGSYGEEYRILHDDGTIRWVSLRGQVQFEDTPNGRVTSLFSGTVLDVTARVLTEKAIRESEQQFRRIADLMPQVVWTARPDGSLDYTNERWTQYSGSRKPENWLDFVHPHDIPKVVESWGASVQSGKPYETEFRLRRTADDSYRWFLVRAQAAYDAHGNIERWFGTCTDIEEQKEALNERSNFISIASHELKTPLTSLKLQTQSMRRNYEKKRVDAFTPEKVSTLIENNEKQVGRLIRLVDDMLDFSKIEAGKLSMVREEANICEIVREVYDRLREQLEAAGCESNLSCDEKIVGYVDRFRIEQVVTNLITNAIRYGKGKSVSLSVRQENQKIMISVSDQGIGISPENFERIFNRFERAVSANDVSGLGLGLFISQQIAEGHQGKIKVQSELGKGSTFTVEIPVEHSHVE